MPEHGIQVAKFGLQRTAQKTAPESISGQRSLADPLDDFRP